MTEAVHRMNPNVRLTLAYCFFSFASRSVFNSSIFSAYVFIQTGNSNSKVGYIAGIMGISKLVAGMSSGICVDKFGRKDTLLKAGCLVSILAILGSTSALLLVKKQHTQYLCLCGTWAVWGIFIGLVDPPRQALFADSVETGKRSKIYTTKTTTVQLASTCGPLLSVVLFACLGDKWTESRCRLVIKVGLSLHILPSLILLGFNDDYALGKSSESFEVDSKKQNQQTSQTSTQELEHQTDEINLDQPLLQVSAPTPSPNEKKAFVSIPVAIVVADIFAGLASGCAIKFFPIFFLQYLHLSPAAVSVIYASSPLATAVAAQCARRVSNFKRVGRVGVAVLFKCVGVILLFVIALAPWSEQLGATNNTDGSSLFATNRSRLSMWSYIIPPVYILRTALMNSTQGLVKSVLMDYVPKSQRGSKVCCSRLYQVFQLVWQCRVGWATCRLAWDPC